MWTDIAAWFQSAGGARVLQTEIVPALAIVVAGLIAALIGRGVVRAAMRQAEHDRAATAVAGLVEAARASGDAEDTRGDRRRTARLRTEADVRLRLLPIAGADLAANWAGARIDAGVGGDAAALAELRDRLIAWTARPSRAKRLFPSAAPAPVLKAVPVRSGRTASESSERAPGPVHGRAEHPAAQEADAAVAPAAPEDAAPALAPAPATIAVEPEPVAAAGTPADPPATVPAWQRTRSGGRLQQERAAKQEEVLPEDEAAPETAPVLLQHAHRAPGAPISDADDAVRGEAHLQARHARGEGGAAAPAAEPEPEPAAAPAARQERPARPADPAWLDTYDDEAQVTQNLDLKTPPPVSVSAIRDRGPRGEDLVPRS